MGSTLSAVERRQKASLVRWRLREKAKEKLKELGFDYEHSKNEGVVYIQTKAGRCNYVLVSGRWSVGFPATKTGVGAGSLKRFVKALDERPL